MYDLANILEPSESEQQYSAKEVGISHGNLGGISSRLDRHWNWNALLAIGKIVRYLPSLYSTYYVVVEVHRKYH